MKPITVPQTMDCTALVRWSFSACTSLVVMTGRTMNLTPSRKVMNTEKFPMAVLGTSEATQLPIRVKISTVHSMMRPFLMSRFLFFP